MSDKRIEMKHPAPAAAHDDHCHKCGRLVIDGKNGTCVIDMDCDAPGVWVTHKNGKAMAVMGVQYEIPYIALDHDVGKGEHDLVLAAHPEAVMQLYVTAGPEGDHTHLIDLHKLVHHCDE